MSGTCQTATISPRNRVAPNGERSARRRGRAKPRQPGSSPIGANTGMTSRIAKRSTASEIERSRITESGAPSATLSPPVPNTTAKGMRIAAAYHCQPTRQRMIRLPSSRSPRRPSTTAVITMAATRGPAAMKMPNGVGAHVIAKASTKNATSGWRLISADIAEPPGSPAAAWACRGQHRGAQRCSGILEPRPLIA